MHCPSAFNRCSAVILGVAAIVISTGIGVPAFAESSAHRLVDPGNPGGNPAPTPPPVTSVVASLAVLQSPLPPLTVIADASGSQDSTGAPPASYHFDFGDGTPIVTTTSPSTQHTFAMAGNHIVRLTVTDNSGNNSLPVTARVKLNPPERPPIGSLSLSQVAFPALTVNADASGSTDTDLLPISTYRFDFGDGTPVAVTSVPVSSVQHTYSAAGSYTVTLTVIDLGGYASAPITSIINVAPPHIPPLASLVVSQIPAPELTVIADASGSTDTSGVAIASYEFDFGDGSPVVTTLAPAATAQHTYATAGNHSVTLTVTDAHGNISLPAVATIAVAPDIAPVASLVLTQLASPPLTILADASGSIDTDLGPIASYHFDFGDGSQPVTTLSPVSTTQHTYTSAGVHTVTLTVTDTDGETSTPAGVVIDVEPPDYPPVASLAVTQLASPPLTVNADASASSDTDQSPIASYQFDFGDGSPVVTTTPPTAASQHTYATSGSHTVTLLVTDTANKTSAPVSTAIFVAPPDYPPVASLVLSQLASPPLTVKADASGSTDTDLTPIANYQFDFGDGSPLAVTLVPTSIAQHTYEAPGNYSVTVTVVDSAGLASTPVSGGIQIVAPDLPPVAHLTLTQLPSPALTVNANASASADTDATPIASYHFDFGDGSPVVTTTVPTASAQHSYAAPGNHTVTLTVTDTGNLTSSPVSGVINVAVPTVVERRVSTSADDAEESITDTSVHLTSSDLEFVHDDVDQVVGMRWTGLAIPPGVTITAAYIQFSSKEAWSDVTNLTFRAQAADNPPTFHTTNGDVSTRPRTASSANWAPVAWPAGQTGPNQRTPDLTGMVQELVSRPGWTSSSALVMIVNGTGHRTAWAWDGNSSLAPLLHVEYLNMPPPELPPVASLTASQLATPALTVLADASNSTDTDLMPIASYHFNFGDGTPVVNVSAPNKTAQHTYAAAGTYTVTLTATDTGNLTSSPVTAPVSVVSSLASQIAVYAGYYDTHHAINPRPKPNPWLGSSNVVFIGQQDNQDGDPPTGAWDTSAMRVDNLSSFTLTGVVVTVDFGLRHFALWGTNNIPPGSHLILAQTEFENLDGSDLYPAGCYGCDPSLCNTEKSTEVPVVHVTISGMTANYPDTAQTMNTGGYDGAGCPYVGGELPETRYDESRAWVLLHAQGGGSRALPAGPDDAAMDFDHRVLPHSAALAPPSPNPVHGATILRFTIARHGPVRVGVFDITGRLVRSCVDDVLDPGEYNRRVDLRGIPAGMYFMRLWTPDVTRHEKFVLMN